MVGGSGRRKFTVASLDAENRKPVVLEDARQIQLNGNAGHGIVTCFPNLSTSLTRPHRDVHSLINTFSSISHSGKKDLIILWI